MAITINGSGTITGLSAGGLPDGSVTNDDLAGSIADGKITGLSSSKLSGALPAISGASLTGITTGKVLQVKSTVVTARNSTTNSTASGTGGDIGLSVSITPTSSTSYFLVTVSIGIGTCTSDSWGIILSRDNTRVGNGASDGNRVGVFIRGVDHAGGSGTHTGHNIGGLTNTFYHQSSGTAGTAITWRANGVTQAGTMYINRTESYPNLGGAYGATTSSSITVMEVEQ